MDNMFHQHTYRNYLKFGPATNTNTENKIIHTYYFINFNNKARRYRALFRELSGNLYLGLLT